MLPGNSKFLSFLIFFILIFSTNFFSKTIDLKFTTFTKIDTDIPSAKTKAFNNLTNFLAGYKFGIKFIKEGDSIQTTITGDISLIGKKSSFAVIDHAGEKLLMEKGSFKITVPVIKEYKRKITVTDSIKGENFWKAYNKLITDLIAKNNVSSGIILPQGKLKVTLMADGISILESFVIYFN